VVEVTGETEISESSNHSSTNGFVTTNVIKDWQLRVPEALRCPGIRSDILDTIAGAPFEFGNASADNSYHQLAAAAAAAYNEQSKDEGDHGNALMRLQQVLLQLVDGADGVPAPLRRRLRELLSLHCDAFSRCDQAGSQDRPLALEIDEAHTSQGAISLSSSWLHRKLLHFGEFVGIARLKDRANVYRSKPASVILGSSTASSVNLRDCFAFRDNSSVALRVQRQNGRDVYINHITIQQPARWSTPRPHASPRRFSVFGMDSSSSQANGATSGDGHYTVPLGSFEYLLSAPHVQAFQLLRPAKNALLVTFEGEAWTQEHSTCLYRVRAYEMPPPSCVGARLARVTSA
jgi:hypothetical protein